MFIVNSEQCFRFCFILNGERFIFNTRHSIIAAISVLSLVPQLLIRTVRSNRNYSKILGNKKYVLTSFEESTEHISPARIYFEQEKLYEIDPNYNNCTQLEH